MIKKVMIVIFILIYLESLVISIMLCYRERKHATHTAGNLIDRIEPFMWFPLMSTIALILIGIGFMITKIKKLLKLSVLWEKFRNIKLK